MPGRARAPASGHLQPPQRRRLRRRRAGTTGCGRWPGHGARPVWRGSGSTEQDTGRRRLLRHEEQMQAQRAQAEQQREAHQAKRRAKPSTRSARRRRDRLNHAVGARRSTASSPAACRCQNRTRRAQRRRPNAARQPGLRQQQAARPAATAAEIEQIDLKHIIAGLGEERLKHYNRVLAERSSRAAAGGERCETHFLMGSGSTPTSASNPLG